MAYVKVRVTPSAKRDSIDGWQGDVLVIKVSAPAERGKANNAICRLLEEALEIRAIGAVNVSRGVTARNKLVRVSGFTDSELRKKLRSLRTK